MQSYTWLTEILAPQTNGHRIVRRDRDGLCAIVHHDEMTGRVRVGSTVSSPLGDAAIEYVVDAWVPEERARTKLARIQSPPQLWETVDHPILGRVSRDLAESFDA